MIIVCVEQTEGLMGNYELYKSVSDDRLALALILILLFRVISGREGVMSSVCLHMSVCLFFTLTHTVVFLFSNNEGFSFLICLKQNNYSFSI